jgi:hypothetical protein
MYSVEADGEPSMAKENNYPSAVSCETRPIKINIDLAPGFAYCSLLSERLTNRLATVKIIKRGSTIDLSH